MHWTGKLATGVSFVVFVLVLFCFTFKQDRFAVVTFFPAWAWGLTGIVIGLFSALYRKHISYVIVISWFIFIIIFAEEPKSLLRGCFISNNSSQNVADDQILTVISLNCGGGNIKAVNEILKYKPDIVLLQEMPSDMEELDYCVQKIFNGNATMTFDSDNAIISGGDVEQVSLIKRHNMFMTQA